MAQRSWTDLAIGVAAGVAAGWYLASRNQSHSVRDLFLGSLPPSASRRAHDAMDVLRDGGSDVLRDLSRRMSKLTR